MARRKSFWAVTVGSVECPQCGLPPAKVTAPTLLGKVGGWLVDGQVPPATRTCADGHEWSFRSHARLVRAEGGVPWWRVPDRLLKVLRDRRNAQPVPLTYLMAMAIGAGLGALLDWWLGWPWWAVMGGFLALVWLVFLSSAFVAGRRDDLLADLVEVVDPNRAAKMRARSLATLAAGAAFPIYGLPASWAGARSFGGLGRSKTLHHLALVHGEPEERPFVVVDSILAGRGSGHTKQDLGRSLFFRHLDSPESPQEVNEWLEDRDRAFQQWFQTPWEEISIVVDGATRRFELRAHGDDWVAVGELGDTVIGLDVGGLRQVSLVTVNDFSPYVAGAIDQRRRRRGT